MKVFDSKEHLVVEIPGGGRRNVAELFDLSEYVPGQKGIIFFDTWWIGATFHPVHVIRGDIRGEGPVWDIPSQDVEIEVINPDLDQGLANEWRRWEEYRRDDKIGRQATRENAEFVLRNMIDGGFLD